MLLHVKSGELYPVNFLPLHPLDIKQGMRNWEKAFNWSIYFGYRNVELYKLVIRGNDDIQGVIALERKLDHVYVHLIESAPRNRKYRVFKRVGLHLIAFACKRSMELGHDGAIALDSKSHLIDYYKGIGGRQLGDRYFVFDELAAERLVRLYLN
ncbi:hypothetical protein D3C74_257160 [compost metagenome]